MKTCEQVTADVLKRRDDYLEKRAARRKQAKRYAAASLLVCAAVFAAAGLFRSGIFGPSPELPPPYHDEATGGNASAGEPSGADGAPAANEKPGAAEPTTVPRAVNTTEPTTAIDLSGRTTYASREETTAPAPATGRNAERPGTANGTPPASEPVGESPSAGPAPGKTPEPQKTEPKAEEPPTDNTACGEPPTQVPVTEEPAVSEEADYCVYVVYNGAVYAAENAAPAAVPAGAEPLGQKDGYAVGFDAGDSKLLSREEASFLVIADAEIAASVFVSESSAGAAPPSGGPGTEEPAGPETEPPSGPEEAWPPREAEKIKITLLALPGASAEARIGASPEGVDGMFVLTYVGPPEE